MNFCKRILNNFYPDVEINYGGGFGGFTLYEDGHFIIDHKDGNNPGRICVIIIYLSSEQEYNNDGGGELVIKTNSQKEYTIKPILGTFSLLDFSKNDVNHQVNVVKNGFKRYSFINFFYMKKD
jgi:Rps23 Pro-64 3,4-dihydroxylase Tpa1-like proline 4-hydroxylase